MSGNTSGADHPARNPTPDEIRALRGRHGLSQSQLIYRLPRGVTLAQLQSWEQGQSRCPPYAWAYVLAQMGELQLPERED